MCRGKNYLHSSQKCNTLQYFSNPGTTTSHSVCLTSTILHCTDDAGALPFLPLFCLCFRDAVFASFASRFLYASVMSSYDMIFALPTLVDLIVLRVLFSLFCASRCRFSSCISANVVSAFSAALAGFSMYNLASPSIAPKRASALSRKAARLGAVVSVYNGLSIPGGTTSLGTYALRTLSSFAISFTLSGLNGKSPTLAEPVRMLRHVRAG